MTTGLLPIVYPLDTTGVSVNNRIIKEKHTLQTRRVRAIVPRNTPFFSNSVTLYDNLTNKIIPKSSYRFFNLLGLASAMYGKEIYTIVLLTDSTISNDVSLSYQALGGEYTRIYDSTKDLIEMIYQDTRPVDWPNIIDRPETFNPNLHLHAVGDGIGFEYVVSALERLRNTFMVASSLNANDILKYIDVRLADLHNENQQLLATNAALSSDAANFSAHIRNFDNPHNTDKSQVGLSKVENYGVGTKADIISPNQSTPKYVVNTALRQYLDDMIVTFTNNVNNTFNYSASKLNEVSATLAAIESSANSLINIQASTNTLSNNYADMKLRVDQCVSNVTTMDSRAQALINQYLNTGI